MLVKCIEQICYQNKAAFFFFNSTFNITPVNENQQVHVQEFEKNEML